MKKFDTVNLLDMPVDVKIRKGDVWRFEFRDYGNDGMTFTGMIGLQNEKGSFLLNEATGDLIKIPERLYDVVPGKTFPQMDNDVSETELTDLCAVAGVDVRSCSRNKPTAKLGYLCAYRDYIGIISNRLKLVRDIGWRCKGDKVTEQSNGFGRSSLESGHFFDSADLSGNGDDFDRAMEHNLITDAVKGVMKKFLGECSGTIQEKFDYLKGDLEEQTISVKDLLEIAKMEKEIAWASLEQTANTMDWWEGTGYYDQYKATSMKEIRANALKENKARSNND